MCKIVFFTNHFGFPLDLIRFQGEEEETSVKDFLSSHGGNWTNQASVPHVTCKIGSVFMPVGVF